MGYRKRSLGSTLARLGRLDAASRSAAARARASLSCCREGTGAASYASFGSEVSSAAFLSSHEPMASFMRRRAVDRNLLVRDGPAAPALKSERHGQAGAMDLAHGPGFASTVGALSGLQHLISNE